MHDSAAGTVEFELDNEVKEGGSTSASQANWGRGGPAGKNTSHGRQKKQHPIKIEML